MAQPSNNAVLREQLSQYTPGGTLQLPDNGYRRVSVQLFGYTGHGKSSLINSCVCAVRDEDYQNVAGAGQTDGTNTLKRKQHALAESICIKDNQGFSTLNNNELLQACAQLRSLETERGDQWQDRLETIANLLPDHFSTPPTDFIVPVIVHSSTDKITQKREDIGRFIRKAYDITGIHPIIVITRRGNENTDRIFTEFGELGATHRVVLENYIENNQTRNEVADNLILKFLSRCIHEADRGIRMRENQDRQQILVTQRRAQIKEETDVQMEEKKKLENRVRELEQEREQKPEQELSRKRCSIS